MKYQSKWNDTQSRYSLPKLECHSKLNVIKNGVWLKMECHIKKNVTKNKI